MPGWSTSRALTQPAIAQLAGDRGGRSGHGAPRGAQNLQVLTLEDTKIGDAGLEYLKGLANLQISAPWRRHPSHRRRTEKFPQRAAELHDQTVTARTS